MSTSLENNFVRQLEFENPSEVLNTEPLAIDSDCRAIVLQDGHSVGEVPSGNHLLRAVSEKLLFWKEKKKTNILLIPNRSVPLRYHLTGLCSSDQLFVDVEIQLWTSIGDVEQFVNNLIGVRNSYSMEEIHEALEPVVRQGLWDVVARMSITDLNAPDVGSTINTSLGQLLKLTFLRYGLEFGEVNLISIKHERFDQLRQREGDAWLLKQENDVIQGEMALRFQRLEIQEEWRKIILSDKFNAMQHEDELQQALLEQDKRGIMRQDDLDEFKRTFRENVEDHDAARNALVRKIDLERQFEYESMKSEMSFQWKMKRFEHEAQLATLQDNEANRHWIESIQREEDEERHRRQNFAAEQEHRRQVLAENKEFTRNEEFAVVLHQQRVDTVSGQLQLEQADRVRRAAEIENEIRSSRQLAILETKKRKDEWQLELGNRQFANQLERLVAMQQLNQQQQRFEQEQYERNKRLDVELSTLADDKAFYREIQRMNLLKEIGPDAVFLMADNDKAAILADLKKHQASEDTKKVVAMAESDAQKAALAATLQERTASETKLNALFEKIGEAERSKAEMLMEQFREALKR